MELTGKEEYTKRIGEWAAVTGKTNVEIGLAPSECFTTSIIVTEHVPVSSRSTMSLISFAAQHIRGKASDVHSITPHRRWFVKDYHMRDLA